MKLTMKGYRSMEDVIPMVDRKYKNAHTFYHPDLLYRAVEGLTRKGAEEYDLAEECRHLSLFDGFTKDDLFMLQDEEPRFCRDAKEAIEYAISDEAADYNIWIEAFLTDEGRLCLKIEEDESVDDHLVKMRMGTVIKLKPEEEEFLLEQLKEELKAARKRGEEYEDPEYDSENEK